jgi:hypothetical protein
MEYGMTMAKTNKTTAADIEEFMRLLEHPKKSEIEALIMLVRAAQPEILVGVKWNAPSFFYKEWFATIHLNCKDAVQIILHLGAKKREDIKQRIAIDDPDNLLQWLGKDRAFIKFRDLPEITLKADAFQNIIRQWLTHLL